MTTIDDISTTKNSACLPSSKRNFVVPQQLWEANELLMSINRRLEDCALEWQAEISRKQWKIFNSNVIGITLSERSLLSRTYFTEKNLDETFQHLLSCNKIFSEYLKNFIDLLQDEVSVSNIKETRDVQNQSYNIQTNCKVLNIANTETMQFSCLNNQHLNGEGRIQDYIDNILTIQNSFTDVIKAKLNFDTKFLGFEAILHKATSTSADTVCLCQYCSNIMQTKTHGTNRKLRSVTVNQRNRTLTKTKRLTLFKKRKREKSSIIVDEVNDQPLPGPDTNFC
ncbi:PREDICTED: uncharacterized protein LOC108550685 [Eufriesea mexicana]|uniref:uncharacterized protein LOC108550685 n=1 Tax=Eufriesea mexicana TaxID=516756 RepID=UPI00083C2510|nr:PREDICTED: uncharacterized protein LOC108550685 [Eufriesea mexicana]